MKMADFAIMIFVNANKDITDSTAKILSARTSIFCSAEKHPAHLSISADYTL